MVTKQGKAQRLSREKWLDHALELLRDEGIRGIRIDRMARDLGVTKGSFYWHFADLDDLHESILEYWATKYSDVISENPEFQNPDPATGLLSAMIRVREGGLDEFEIAMRSWAEHDPNVDAAVREVYQRRQTFVRGCFTRLGFKGLDAEVRTRSLLCYMSWEPSMYVDESPRRRINLLKRHIELLTKTPCGDEHIC